jgi:hypothetical protein
MTADGDSVSKPPMVYLSEGTKVGRMLEALQQMHFNKHEEGRLVLDRVARNFLIHASRAAAADPDRTIHEVLRQHGPVRR